MTSALATVHPPNGWEHHRFGRVVVRSKAAGRPDLQPLSVFLDQGVVPRASREDNFNRLGEDMSKYLVVRSGDIVFNKLRTWQGGFGLSHYEGIVSPAYFVCRPMPLAEPRFLNYLLHSVPYLAELTRVSKFMPPSQFDILWDDLRMIPIPLPPVDVQCAIADYLDAETARIDALIDAKRALLARTREREQALVHALLDEASGESRTIQLGQVLARLIDYRGATPEKSDTGVPLLTASNITGGRIDVKIAPQFVSETLYGAWMRRGLPEPGDILMTTEAPLGEVAIIDDPRIALAQRLMLLRARRDLVSPEYLYVYLRSPVGQAAVLSRASGSTVMGIRTDRLRGVPILVPSVAAQCKIADRARRAREAAQTIELRMNPQVDLLVEHRQALVTAAVTGELMVRA